MRARAALAVGVTVIATLGLPARAGTQNPRGAVRLEHVADFNAATAMAVRTGDDSLYIAEQAGRVRAVDTEGNTSKVLDIRSRVEAFGERGLLGLAFSPDGTRLYVDFTNRAGDTRVEEYEVAVDGSVTRASRRQILAVDQPQTNHNGGQLEFGPDGMLYIGLGDGGNEGDEGDGHAEGGNGQSLHTLLGKILRIDPTPSGKKPYTIPSDNPFADGGGRPEIWAFGLRNPWRFSFDRATGDLWIGDVGQDAWEEIDLAPASRGAGSGTNFGWNVYEARHRFRDGDTTGPAVPPLLALSHDQGYCAVIGGYVYRGEKIPELQGSYVYADNCNGTLRYVRQIKSEVKKRGSLGVKRSGISAFGQDNDGELYVLSQTSGLYRIDAA